MAAPARPAARSRSLRLAAVVASLLVAMSARAEPQTFVLEPASTHAHFELMHFGTSTIRGRFGPVPGTVTLDRARGSGELGLRIDTRTLDTGIPVLNARLKQADLIAVEAFPEAYYVARQFRFEGDRLAEVRGEFTFRGISQALSLTARRFGCRIEINTEICGGDFEGELLRSEFGASLLVPLVGDRVRLLVQVEGQRALSPAR